MPPTHYYYYLTSQQPHNIKKSRPRIRNVSLGFTRYTSNVEVFTDTPQTWRFLPIHLKRGGFLPVNYPAIQPQTCEFVHQHAMSL